jgi:hypothetical protein
MGLDWKDFQKTRREFSSLAAVPVSNNAARVVGVVSANAGISAPNGRNLTTKAATGWLEEVAAVIWDDLPQDLREQLELLAI